MSDSDERRTQTAHLIHHPILRLILVPLSLVYALAMRVRGFLYGLGVLSSTSLGCAVISVGNLTTGGTGKTVVVASIVRWCLDHNKRVAILLRGYKRSQSTERIVVVSDGQGHVCSLERSGDEAQMLAEIFPEVPILVGKDRVETGRAALQKFDVDTLILDDGFQHLALRRKTDVVLIDATAPFGNGFCLPAGHLREDPIALRRAETILITKSDMMSKDVVTNLIKQLRPLNPRAIIGTSRHRDRQLCSVDPDAKKTQDCELLRRKRIAALAGIGTPETFFQQLTGRGADLVARMTYDDHHAYTQEDCERILQRFKASGADWLVTTHKDAVRLKRWSYLFPEHWYYLAIDLQLLKIPSWGELLYERQELEKYRV